MHNLTKILVVFCIVGYGIPSHADNCEVTEAIAAESVTDYLDSWGNVYKFYGQFKHCYDGAIAEGAEDAIERLWYEHWDKLPQMIELTNKDAGFKDFMWKRVHDEIFPAEWYEEVAKKAKNKCPKEAKEFCREFSNAKKKKN